MVLLKRPVKWPPSPSALLFPTPGPGPGEVWMSKKRRAFLHKFLLRFPPLLPGQRLFSNAAWISGLN